MLTVLTLFPTTIDNETVDDITAKATKAFKTADGLLSLKVSEGQMMSAGGPPLYSRVMLATFESLESFMAWVESPPAQASKDEVSGLGIVRLFFNTAEL